MSELGDETFIIAAILAMRHPRSLVFAGGIAALATMTVLSTLLGMMAPALISKELVNKAACFLYICFGAPPAAIRIKPQEPEKLKGAGCH